MMETMMPRVANAMRGWFIESVNESVVTLSRPGVSVQYYHKTQPHM